MPNQCEYIPCPQCAVGEYRANCGAADPGVCLACSKAPNTYFTGSGGMTDACPVKLCGRDDEECDLGMYRQDCGTVENPTSPGICAPCVLHKEKYFWVSNGGVSRRGCNEAPCQRCSAGFVRIGCEGASEGTCEPCSYEPGFFSQPTVALVSET